LASPTRTRCDMARRSQSSFCGLCLLRSIQIRCLKKGDDAMPHIRTLSDRCLGPTLTCFSGARLVALQ